MHNFQCSKIYFILKECFKIINTGLFCFFPPSYFRQEGQGTVEEVRSRDFRRELEDRERSVREKRDKHRGGKPFCP